MKIWKNRIIYILPALVLFYACNPEIEVPAPVSGSADFSKYIAVGNSLTAGYGDNGLYADGQMQSYPKMIAQQMSEITPSDFSQPDIPGNGSGYLYVTSLDLSTSPPDVEFGEFDADPGWLDQLSGSFNNLGVPGIRVRDVKFPGYGSSPEVNPYFYRMLGDKSPLTTYLELVQESAPTFFTCWMGNNDVLGYAASGGVAGIEGGPLGMGGLTPVNLFDQYYGELISALTTTGAKGVVVTIPDITLAPFFTTVKWNDLALDDDLAGQANAFYASQIDPEVESKVQEAVIAVTVTEQAVSAMVVPAVAQGTVYQQVYQQAKDGGATDAEADAAATAYVASPEGQAAIAQLEAALNAELQNHLLGDHSNHQSLEPIYAVIDNELATNAALQAGIAQGIADLTAAYENDLLPADQMAALDAAIDEGTQQQIIGLKAAGIYPVFGVGPNPFVIEVPVTASNPLGIRQMIEGEIVLLTALLDGQLEGTLALAPKATQYILTSDEVKNINDFTDDFNEIIRGHASSADIAVFESNDVLEDVNDGAFTDGVNIAGDFLTGGAFSLDGIHLTPRGYSLVANGIIQVANKSFNSTMSPVSVNNYRAVILP